MSQRIGGYNQITATVPGTASQYASEIGHVRQGDAGRYDEFDKLEIYVESLPASAELEVDLVKPGNPNPVLDTDFILDTVSITATGFATVIERVAWPGARIRVVSGGTGGSCKFYYTWK